MTMKNMLQRFACLSLALSAMAFQPAQADFVPGQILTAQQLNNALAAPTVTGGSINGAPVGNVNPNTGAFTSLSSSGLASLNGLSVSSAPTFQIPLPITSGGTNASTATGATSSLQYLQGATGSSARSIASKFQDHVSVKDFGAQCSPTDDSVSFQSAINALPSGGGEIDVPECAYVINTVPTWGSKSIYWNISTGATFSGSGVGQGKFPYMSTNTAQLAVGPFIQSQSTQTSTDSNGGIAAFNVEMLQPSTYVGQSVGLYAGASGSNSNSAANVWAINSLVHASSGAGGTYQNIEADVDNFSASALVKGISINGVGSYNPTVGLEVIRSDSTRWKMGVHVMHSITGMQIDNTSGLTNGILINGGPAPSYTLLSGTQLGNGDDSILLQRATDSSPSGYFLRAVNAANTANLYTLDTSGNETAASVTGATVTSSGQFLAASGSASAPSYAFSGGAGYGFYRSGSGIGVAFNGNAVNGFSIQSVGDFELENSGIVRWSSAGIGATTDVALARSSAGVLEVDNGTAGSLATLKAATLISTGIGAMPLYSATGTGINAPHMVTGSVALSSGSATVTLSGSAAYSSSTSYACSASDTTSASAVKVSQGSGVSITFSGATSDTVQYLCAGS